MSFALLRSRASVDVSADRPVTRVPRWTADSCIPPSSQQVDSALDGHALLGGIGIRESVGWLTAF
jgi:hypothetical protein